MSKDRLTFTLMDMGYKKSGPVQIFDERTCYDGVFNENGDPVIIKFPEQLAIVTHALMLQDSALGSIYQSKAEQLIDAWINSALPSKVNLDYSIASEPCSALQYSLFNDLNLVPFPGPKNPKFTFIDLFAGIGGFRMALQNLGGQCVFSSEWDAQAQKTYFANYGEVPFGDITSEQTKQFIPDNFDILCAGFPCQAFSLAGKRLGFEETRGTLFSMLRKFSVVSNPKRSSSKMLKVSPFTIKVKH